LFQVKIWFQNRRMKWRNSKERELIAAGGCREQTLPTKHNPNPDLSDPVGAAEKAQQTPFVSKMHNVIHHSSGFYSVSLLLSNCNYYWCPIVWVVLKRASFLQG
jgi:hypothetical protein